MSSLAKFIKGSYTEFKDKVEWPKWSDLQSSTIVVSLATIVLAIVLFGVDEFISKVMRNLIQILVDLVN